MFAKITGVKGDQVILKLDDELNIDKLERFANGKQPMAELVIEDGRQISPDQRKKIFALMHDVSQFTGYDERDTEMELKYMYYAKTGADTFSMANCSVSQANEFLTFILDFCFEQNIPFRTKIWDSIVVDYHLTLQCLKYRKCIVCGKHADIHHVDVLGNRKRDWTDHRRFRMLPLCRVHHQEIENSSQIDFMQKHQVKGIKLPPRLLIDLHIMTKKQMKYWDARYQRSDEHAGTRD